MAVAAYLELAADLEQRVNSRLVLALRTHIHTQLSRVFAYLSTASLYLRIRREGLARALEHMATTLYLPQTKHTHTTSTRGGQHNDDRRKPRAPGEGAKLNCTGATPPSLARNWSRSTTSSSLATSDKPAADGDASSCEAIARMLYTQHTHKNNTIVTRTRSVVECDGFPSHLRGAGLVPVA